MDIWIPVFVAVVTGGFSLLGAVLAGKRQTKDLAAQLDKQQAVFEAHVTEQIGGIKIDVKRLEDKQDAHNKFIERTYALETESLRHADELKRLGARLSVVEEKK